MCVMDERWVFGEYELWVLNVNECGDWFYGSGVGRNLWGFIYGLD